MDRAVSDYRVYLQSLGKRVVAGEDISFAEALDVLTVETEDTVHALVETAYGVFQYFNDARADLCALVNAKSGRCSEDCSFCAQSGQYNVPIEEFPLLSVAEIIGRAEEAEAIGAHRFCIVTSGVSLNEEDFDTVIQAYQAIRERTSLSLDGSLGLVNDNRIERLKAAGVTRYNHNLETSEYFFPHICTTHTFQDRFQTVKRLKHHGLEVCCGGIIGLGEERSDRISLAFSLKELDVDCVPINILHPREGTPLEHMAKLNVSEIIKTIAVFRLILPRAIIKIAGGREINLGDAQALALRAGANGIIIGGYLTTRGNPVERDKALIQSAGLTL